MPHFLSQQISYTRLDSACPPFIPSLANYHPTLASKPPTIKSVLVGTRFSLRLYNYPNIDTYHYIFANTSTRQQKYPTMHCLIIYPQFISSNYITLQSSFICVCLLIGKIFGRTCLLVPKSTTSRDKLDNLFSSTV